MDNNTLPTAPENPAHRPNFMIHKCNFVLRHLLHAQHPRSDVDDLALGQSDI